MTLEEAIKHVEEVAELNENIAYNTEPENWMDIAQCEKCAAEHRQLAEWLSELQERRKQPEIIRCKDCIKGKYHNLAKSTMCMLHPFNPVRVEPDGFCKWAERRTDGRD